APGRVADGLDDLAEVRLPMHEVVVDVDDRQVRRPHPACECGNLPRRGDGVRAEGLATLEIKRVDHVHHQQRSAPVTVFAYDCGACHGTGLAVPVSRWSGVRGRPRQKTRPVGRVQDWWRWGELNPRPK